ncbi:MAG TPA: response regulator [Candidatus Acidoferrum sp.]|nr:response regulator [Candidatus Acidoferrum sp.]
MKLLIIDDDPLSRAVLLEIIGQQPELEVQEAGNGVEALDVLHTGFRPDLCLLDLQMPEMGGIELLQRMRVHADYRNLKVVVTSASRERRTIETLSKLQISGYLLKPFDIAKSQVMLQQVLAAGPVAPKPVRKPAKLSLLAVDDDPVVRTFITEYVLSTSDWDVQLASDGNEAFELLYGGLRPDLIVTDLNMPKADGISLIGRIRKDRNFANLQVAVVSGDRNPDAETQLADLNVFSWLQKPVTNGQMDVLFDRVRRRAS